MRANPSIFLWFPDGRGWIVLVSDIEHGRLGMQVNSQFRKKIVYPFPYENQFKDMRELTGHLWIPTFDPSGKWVKSLTSLWLHILVGHLH